MRKIIHVDMDAFYASIEQRDNPALQGLPVIVGGNPHKRSVVATCSYEARAFGIKSAMSCSQAERLCPHAIFVPPRFSVYKTVSQEIIRIFTRYTSIIETIALDEAYLDVTENSLKEPSAQLIAKKIQEDISKELNLTASCGVSFNKFLAKVASDWKKPNGLTVITPNHAPSFIDALPIKKFHTVGPATEKKMLSLGITHGKNVKEKGDLFLSHHFGKQGLFLWQIANGHDPRIVVQNRKRKSIGKEITLEEDTQDKELLTAIMKKLIDNIVVLLEKNCLFTKVVTLKIRYSTFERISRSSTITYRTSNPEEIFSVATFLLNQIDIKFKKVRLIGISCSVLEGYL